MVQLPMDHARPQILWWSILQLGGCDAVLGVEWLKKYSSIISDFNQLSLTFTKEGKPVNISNTSELNMIITNGLHSAKGSKEEGR